MKAQFTASFARDLQSIRDKAMLKRVQEAIEQVEQAQNLPEITNLKKLKGGETTTVSELENIESGS